MKFNLKVFITFLALTAAFGCSEKEEKVTDSERSLKCLNKYADLIGSQTKYLSTLTVATCEAHKAMIRDFNKTCPDYYSVDDAADMDEKKADEQFLSATCKDG